MQTAQYADCVAAIDRRLGEFASDFGDDETGLGGAVRYALLAPGKRLRPLISVLLAGDDETARAAAADAGCACEMVHTASLIFDDLPSMDDASTRRGKPCVHIAFSESTAILAAIGLLNKAYEIVANIPSISEPQRLSLVRQLTSAIGVSGLIGGQHADLYAGAQASREDIVSCYDKKTGALFEFAILAGAIVRGMSQHDCETLRTVSHHLGVAFQVHDDLIDALGDCETAMKDCGKDKDKATYVSRKSSAEIRERILSRKGDALSALARVREASVLHHLVAEQFDRAISRAG